ncbi:MAG: PQQ-binding-like beta-propeller repeat protein [Phycisphaerae bacterium]
MLKKTDLRRLRTLGVMTLVVISIVTVARSEDAPAPRPIQDAKVTAPTGDYALVTLTFETPKAEAIDEDYMKWRYVGGMRDGSMLIRHGIGLTQPGGELTLKDGKLTGSFIHALKTHKRRQHLPMITVNATVSDGKVTGSATVGEHEGTVSGTIVPETELTKRNAIPKDKGWPMFLGPIGGGTAMEPTAVELIDSKKDIDLMWVPEETGIGQGIGSISRFMDLRYNDAAGKRTSSGSAAPVAGDGMIFMSYYVPTAATAPSDKKVQRVLENAKQDDKVNAPTELPWYVMEKLYPKADDVVLAMDAETGKTLWKTTMVGRGINHQHHKEGPFDMTPAYADGRVFAIGMSGWLYALDAKTGKPLWEVQIGPHGRSRLWSSSVVAAPGVAIAPQGGRWSGFDPETGKRLWQSDIRYEQSTLPVWKHADKHYVIGGSKDKILCVDTTNGTTTWSVDRKVLSHGRGLGCGGLSVYDDYLLGYLQIGEGKKDHKKHAAVWRLTEKGAEKLWEHPVPESNAEHVPVIVNKRYVFLGDLKVVDLESGKVAAQGKGIMPGNGGYMQAMGDLALVRRDGTHGAIETAIYRIADDGSVTCLTPDNEWSPTYGPGTTSYHHALMYPLIDGRMFVRQADGVFCWDLRKSE